MTHLMVQIGSSGKARCAAPGHRASATTRPAGRYGPPEAGFSGLPDSVAASLMMAGITALGAPCRKAGKSGEMSHYYLPLVSQPGLKRPYLIPIVPGMAKRSVSTQTTRAESGSG